MVVLVGLFALAVAEIWVAVLVAQVIGALPTALALVGLSLLGVLLVRSEGIAVWRRVNAELAGGRAPTGTLLEGFMVVVGGVLLILPGFLTAIPGLLLLLPPTRALLRPVLQGWIERRAGRSATFGGFTFATASFDRPQVGFEGGRVRRGSHVVDAEATDAEQVTGTGDHAEVVEVEVDRPDELGRPG